jgi:hypothetical protein
MAQYYSNNITLHFSFLLATLDLKSSYLISKSPGLAFFNEAHFGACRSTTNSGAVLKMDAQPRTPIPATRDYTSAVYSFIARLSNFRCVSPLSRLGVRLLAKASAARGLPLSP